MNNCRLLSLMVCLFTAALLQINIQAQTLLYHWNFDNTTGSVSTLTTPPAYVDTADGYTGGTFGVALNASSQLSMPAGSGLSNAWSNAPADLAWTCTTAYSAAGPIYQAGVGGLNQIANSFTVTLWMKYNATVTSFSALNCRLLNISSGPAQDGYELYFSMNSGNLIQVGVDNSGTGPTSGNAFGSLGASPQTMTNQWFFVAITYTNSSSGTVNIYTGTANSPASLVATLTGVAPGTAGAINWSSITNYMDVGNSWKDNDGDRTFPGSIDNVRIFNGAGNLQFIDNVQAADQGTGVLPGPPGKNVTWMGNISANWNTNTFNWTSSAVETNYANGDVVLFNDSAIVTTVKVGTNISPGSVTVSNNTLAYVLSGIGGIGGTGGLTKQGTNTLTLSGTNTYSGTTTVSNGTLLVNGNNLGAGPVSVNAHGILCGVGTIAGAVTIQSGGILAPGAGAGTAAALTLSNSLTLVSDSFTSFRVQTGGIKDQIVSGGTVTYGGTLTVTNVGSFPLVAGDTFKLFTAADYSGSFAAIKLPALMDNLVWINTLANNGTLSVAALTAPVVTNLPATGVQGSLATLNGKVVSTGNQTPTVTLYYGPADGGANAAAWSNSVVLGSQDGSFSYLATGLSTNMTYYYAARAANGVGIVWATPSQSFTTLAADPSSAPTLVQYLSGTDKDHTVPWQFSVSSGNNAGIATNLPVPSCWPCQGFGTFSYTQNTGPGMTRADAETGYYTNTFSVPSAWAGKEIFLVFEGVLTDTSASINGHSVGPTHQGGYYEFRYDATPYVVVGANTNVLTVTVRKFSANASVEGAEEGNVDYWIFGGIYRPVYLEAKPPAYIDYVAANPLANGNITVSTYLGGITTNYTVRAFVTDTNNVMLGGVFSHAVSAGASNEVLSASLPTPNAWSSESPTLYTLTVQLVTTNGVVLHSVTNQIGFRTVTFVANQGFFINGKKVTMRGVCHHEEWPTTGRTTSRAEADLDIEMMKDINFNAVRMSHYPPNKVFLEECDRLGLYVLDELDSYQFQIDTADGARLIGEMIRRDVNHPSIIAWDNGNEGGANPNLDGGATGSTNYFDLYDVQNRLVIHPANYSDSFNGVYCWHYLPYTSFINMLGAGQTVYMPTEILHSSYDGGGGASLQEYWDAMRTAPNGGGMFLWSWDDQGIIRGDLANQMDVRGSSAPDGIVGPYREKEASYYTYKEIYSPVQIGAPDPASFTGALNVTNRFDFTDLSQCTFDWQLGWYPDAGDPTNHFSTNALTGGFLVASDSGSFSSPSLAPGSGNGTAGSLALPAFPSTWTNYDALRLTATDPYGRNIYTWTWPLHTPTQIRDRILGRVSASTPAITVGENVTDIVVTNGPRIFQFGKTTGMLDGLMVSNQPVSFNTGPTLVAGSGWGVTSLTNYSDGTNYIILVNDITSAANGFQWTLRPDGWLKLSYRYTLTGSQSYMGITFNYPSNNVTAMNWLGQGPYRVWKNRSAGQEIFTHTKAYNFTWTGQSTNYGASFGKPTTQWTYPEFEGYHGQLYWATFQTTEQPITMVTPTTNLFLRVFTPPTTDRPNGTWTDPPFPSGGISFLHGISAIGDRFELPNAMGPSGGTNVATGLYTGEANFFFGPLPASGADRDGNGLIDAWELQYFGTLGQNPRSTANPDGQPFMVENAFGLSPLVSNTGLSLLPRLKPGSFSPVALAYSVPVNQADFYNFVPRISGDLFTWYGADLYPQYFLISSNLDGTYAAYSVEPNLQAWPGNTNLLFLLLQVGPK